MASKPRPQRRKAKPAAVKPGAAAKSTAAAQEAKQAVKPDFEAEVARLAELNTLEYAHISKTEAQRLGVPVSALTKAVNAHRKAEADEAKAKAKPSPKALRPRQAPETSTRAEDFAPKFSEEWLSLGFAKKYRSKLRYVKKWGAWMDWTGTRWAQEDTLLAYDLIRKECRAAAAEAALSETDNVVADLSKAKTRGAVETLARSDRLFASTTEQWDADDWLLNAPNGIIDLKTGKNIGHNPSKYCTKITDNAPGSDCKLWERFLDKVTDGDKELQAYIKRMCGYFLTGSIREHALFFIYGPGGNRKGVFLNTISAVMGMYHVVSPAQTFAEQKNQRHETELARLNGARLVISQETEQGQYWAEARIKSLTGGDKIAARFMRGDYFEFDPKFKLCIVGNHKPQLRAVDDAIRRRFNLIPFDVKIAPDEKDPELLDKLKAEYGGILAWMIEGCLEWQRDGLNPPEKVLAATCDYLDSEDTIGLWLSDMCITPGSYRTDAVRRKAASVHTVGASETALAALFKSWKEYAEASNFPPKNNKFLGEQLANRGFAKGRDMRGAFFKGLRLKTQQERVLDGVSGPEDGFMTQHDADSLSTVYARTHAHARDTAEMRGSSCCVIDGDAGNTNGGYVPATAPVSPRAHQANSKKGFNGSSLAEGSGKANRGTRTSGTFDRCSVSAALATLDDDGCSDGMEVPYTANGNGTAANSKAKVAL